MHVRTGPWSYERLGWVRVTGCSQPNSPPLIAKELLSRKLAEFLMAEVVGACLDSNNLPTSPKNVPFGIQTLFQFQIRMKADPLTIFIRGQASSSLHPRFASD